MQILHIASGKNTGANMTERAVRKSIPLGADYTANITTVQLRQIHRMCLLIVKSFRWTRTT